MELSIVVNAHNNERLLDDTIDAIKTYCTKDYIVLVDGASWQWGKKLKHPVLKGFYHNYSKGPYRNMTLGLRELIKAYPNSDWYCYCEHDVLFCSSEFKKTLKQAQNQNIWLLGNDLRFHDFDFSYLENIIGETFKHTAYLLGCCVFFNKVFLKHLQNIDFFDKFLTMTNGFDNGFFPRFEEYDFGEHLYATLANHFGSVAQLARWHPIKKVWEGSDYLMRWNSEVEDENAWIIHPSKNVDGKARIFHRNKRKNV